MNKLKKFVALALVLCMILTVMPIHANAASEDFLRVYHLDCGRKFFDTADVEELIDLLSENGYTHLELALGNDGLRLILDDMSVLGYDTDDIIAGIQIGNRNYSHTGEWTEAEMDAIIDYANARSIEIIPLINTPGHMDAILDAMEYVGINGSYNGSKRTVDVTNARAVEFTQALVSKYVEYFASKGCTYFNMGADEYANDVYTSGSMGFGHLQTYGLYDEYADYINGVAAIIKDAGMTPIAFNDGLYFNNSNTAKFDSDIVVSYWTSGWSSYKVASASTLASKGHKILNTNDGWYYVLGRASGTYGYAGASQNVVKTPVTDVPGSNDPAVIGSMICLWCDEPYVSYASYKSDAHYLAETLAKNNPDYFVVDAERVNTVTENGVSVTVAGLESITAEQVKAPAIPGASEVVAYDVSLMSAYGPYTGAAEIRLPIPADWTDVRGGVLASESGKEVLGITGKVENGTFVFTAPHFSTVVAYEVAPRGDAAENRTITVNVGGTATNTITGGDYTASIDETDLDKNIATVSATFRNVVTEAGEPVKASSLTSGGTYIIGNGSGRYMTVSGTTISSTQNYEDATKFTVTGSNGSWKIRTGNYYLRHNNNSLTVSTTDSSNTWSYDGTRFSYSSGSTTYRLNTDSNGSWRVSTSTSRQGAAYTVTPASTTPTTTVTFRGVTEGTTYVQVGGVYYTINVVDQIPSNALTANSVTLEYWITNLRVTCNRVNSATISNTTAGVNTDEGVDLTTIAGATGTWDYGNVVYWKSVRLDSANRQTTDSGDDETADGTIMTHVRRRNGAWQYKTADGVWNYFLSSDQLVAYYLMPTTVTDQITTLTKDWGYKPSENTDSPSAGQVALSFAVVDAGTLTPSEANIFNTSTTIFNYWAGRDIGVVAPVSNENYEVYKITVTEGVRSSGTSNNWKTGAPRWNKTTNDLGTGEWFDEREVWNISEGTDPMVNGKLDNIVWPAKNTAFLILFYVRATNANLTVRYVDDSLAGATITERGVFANQGENFYDMKNTALPNADGEHFTLGDNATLTYYNYETEKNVVQTFEKSLLNFQDIQPQYRSGAYKYVGSELADDGKTLILHYNIDETVLDPRYVVDFGLSVSVPLNKIVQNYGTSDVKSVQMMNAAYGKAVIENGVLTYTPDTVLQSPAAVTLRVTNSNNTITIFNVGFIPASTMYYEEGFAAYTGDWGENISTGSGEQGLQVSADTDGNYGHDGKYAAETGMSNGTEAVSSTNGDKAELVFTGTGIDVYANCDADTSVMMAMLYRADGSLAKIYQVDTRTKDGTSDTTGGQAGESFGLPVVSIQGLAHGGYRLVLQHMKAADSDSKLRIDGFRVYNTLTPDAYAKDYASDEMNPTFLELRNAVLTALDIEADDVVPGALSDAVVSQVFEKLEDDLNGALVLSGNAKIDAEDLLNNGPKNELFLRPGESVSFTLANGVTAQIGLKAVNGSVSYNVNGKIGTITTAADMFYLEGTKGNVTITNTSGGILSVTKLKLFGAASAAEALAPISEELVVHALQTMGLVEKPEPVNPFADVEENSFYYDAVLWAVENGITTGADATHFLPEADCQRASVVTFLWRAAGSPEPETAVNPFVDVNEGDFYYKAVMWAVENGITTGVDENHFAPFNACNRAQVVTFLWRAEGSPVSAAVNPFADVAEGQWYTDAVLWAVENGVTTGMSETVFGVGSICNRAQIVTFLYRAK